MLQKELFCRLSLMNILVEDVYSQSCSEKGWKNKFLSTIWTNEDHFAEKNKCDHPSSKNDSFTYFHHALLFVGLLLAYMPSYTFKLSTESELLAKYWKIENDLICSSLAPMNDFFAPNLTPGCLALIYVITLQEKRSFML